MVGDKGGRGALNVCACVWFVDKGRRILNLKSIYKFIDSYAD